MNRAPRWHHGHSILSVIRIRSAGCMPLLYFFLIMAFNYFYISIQYNPMEIANNLSKEQRYYPGHPSW